MAKRSKPEHDGSRDELLLPRCFPRNPSSCAESHSRSAHGTAMSASSVKCLVTGARGGRKVLTAVRWELGRQGRLPASCCYCLLAPLPSDGTSSLGAAGSAPICITAASQQPRPVHIEISSQRLLQLGLQFVFVPHRLTRKAGAPAANPTALHSQLGLEKDTSSAPEQQLATSLAQETPRHRQ